MVLFLGGKKYTPIAGRFGSKNRPVKYNYESRTGHFRDYTNRGWPQTRTCSVIDYMIRTVPQSLLAVCFFFYPV